MILLTGAVEWQQMMVDSYGPTMQRSGYAVREQPQQQARERQPVGAPASSSPGQARSATPLDEQYRPLVIGYLTALTGNAEAARRLAREVMGYVFASQPRAASGVSGDNTSHLAADLLLAATDAGLAYLRHVRALQLAGVGGPAPIPPVRRAGPTRWLRAAFERFRPAAAPASPSHGSLTSRTARQAAPTRRLRREERPHARERENVSYEQVRRKVLRAVLADLVPEDARCLALHLVAGLSAAEGAYLLGVAPDVVAERVYAGVEAVAVRYDEALGMLGLSPSLFVQTPAAETLGYQGPPTLRQRAAVTPTQHLTRTPPASALARTAPLRAVHTLPAPYHASVVPVISPGVGSAPLPAIPEPAPATARRLTQPGSQVFLRRPLPTTVPRARRMLPSQSGHGGAAFVPVRSPASPVSG